MTRQPELAAKQVEILKETFPDRTRLAALWDALSADQLSGAERAAKSLHLTLRALKLENPPYDIAAAFRHVAEGDPQAEIVLSSPLFGPHNMEIAESDFTISFACYVHLQVQRRTRRPHVLRDRHQVGLP